jgi:3-phosphoshikimate 1-carboxyvinyltransferase
VRPLERPLLPAVRVPGDFSSAVFLIVAALLVPDSQITIRGVGLNPTRTAALGVLRHMGADVEVVLTHPDAVEPMGDITARSSALQSVDIEAESAPLVIDELPIWALAAARADGVSHLRGAGELRVKESDRLSAISALLTALGVEVRETTDGLDITGRPQGWQGGGILTHGDHRLAMVGAVAGLASTAGVAVDDDSCIAVSYPGFAATIDALRIAGG